VFTEMFDRIEQAAADHGGAWRMLTRTPRRQLGNIAKFAVTGR